MKKLIFIFFAVIIAKQVSAQQDPQYTQYMYNMNVINPAYAGISEGLSVGVLYRSQWVGLDGGPETFTFNIHSPVGKQLALGLSVISDKIGPAEETNAYVDASYTIPTGMETRLAFGIKGGFTFYNVGLIDLTVADDFDPNFEQNTNETSPNIGAGIYFYKPNKYYISVSVPNILNGVSLDYSGKKIDYDTEHLFASVGYVFDLSENFKLKPHAFLKYEFDAPISYDINANLFMYDFVEVGVGYRLDDSFSGMVNFMVTEDLRIGYAYDAINSGLQLVAPSSHEVFINFDFNFSSKVSRSPRYF
jgi:type IX secretion system PorP/SprF family membrane protein